MDIFMDIIVDIRCLSIRTSESESINPVRQNICQELPIMKKCVITQFFMIIICNYSFLTLKYVYKHENFDY